MRRKLSRCLSALLLALCLSPLAAESPGHAAAGDGVDALSPELRAALGAEMAALQAGMQALIPAVVAGQWEEVARIGRQMRDSYIMKQSLSEAQLEALHDALPASFLELDARFHYQAGMLAHAAEAEKPELVGFYLGSMTETCVSCHSRHARAKFPAFGSTEPADDHHH
jgi:hypothetical protein